ncbi:115aa long hypothetical protein [Pyrococcus horikoshii OT3]|uniref:Uncharacterized protein n=1 Tax=Pyrococcus horikoshii (strain ATCC 700860 / DSM 12428 / JCM 9974 / NBRC 100139 / OT-3) TaxID=70601 RepID=O59017_PYRHO|nr:115aa long hypothetical protein [Pyrococcus horikoshii OT3]
MGFIPIPSALIMYLGTLPSFESFSAMCIAIAPPISSSPVNAKITLPFSFSSLESSFNASMTAATLPLSSALPLPYALFSLIVSSKGSVSHSSRFTGTTSKWAIKRSLGVPSPISP